MSERQTISSKEFYEAMGRAGRALSDALAKMAQPQPDVRRLGQELARMQRTSQAADAMAAAYRGDLDGLRTALGALPTEQVREIYAAAALLASTADQVLGEADDAPEPEASAVQEER